MKRVELASRVGFGRPVERSLQFSDFVLAATRTGLTPAGDHELMSDHDHIIDLRLWAHSLARRAPTLRPALHADQLLVAKPRRALFAELTNKLLRRGAHRSVQALNTDIYAWIETWNDEPRPFVWTKTADELLDAIAR
jgi:hypothetical protein